MSKILAGICEEYWEGVDSTVESILVGLTIGNEYELNKELDFFIDSRGIKRTTLAFKWEEYCPAMLETEQNAPEFGFTVGKTYLINPVKRTVVDDDGDVRPEQNWTWTYLYPPLKTRKIPISCQEALKEIEEFTQELPTMRLSNDSDERKNTPIFSGVLNYFPLAIAAVAQLSKKGNDKHNPGEPLHWAKGKSIDHKDCISRHLIDAGTIDPDSEMFHDVGLAWRALANLETLLESQSVSRNL